MGAEVPHIVQLCEQIVSSLILFAWAKFSNGPSVGVTLAALRQRTYVLSELAGESKDEKDPLAERRAKLFAAYPNTYTDGIDVILLHFVETDVLEVDQLLNEYRRRQITPAEVRSLSCRA